MYCAQQLGESRLYHCTDHSRIFGMAQQAADKQVDGPVVMMQVAVPYLDGYFGKNELNVVLICYAYFSQPLCQLIFCWRKGVSGVIVKGFRAPEPGKPSFDRAQFRRQCWAHQREALVETRLFRIEASEVGDYFLEFCQCNFVVFDLDVNPLDPVGVRVTNIDVAGALVKE